MIKSEKTRKKNISLIFTNIVTISILFFVLIRENYPQKIYNRIYHYVNNIPTEKPHKYAENGSYLEQIDFYTTYNHQKNIVMLGNSFTYRINWMELLNRNDVANRGVGGDITDGYINRLYNVFELKPKICFIEGGINDVSYNVSTDRILKNINLLIDTLKSKNISPVLTTISYFGKNFKDAKKFNKQIKQINKAYQLIAKNKGIHLIDLNSEIAEGDFSKKEYLRSDDAHYNSKTYLLWRKAILRILVLENI